MLESHGSSNRVCFHHYPPNMSILWLGRYGKQGPERWCFQQEADKMQSLNGTWENTFLQKRNRSEHEIINKESGQLLQMNTFPTSVTSFIPENRCHVFINVPGMERKFPITSRHWNNNSIIHIDLTFPLFFVSFYRSRHWTQGCSTTEAIYPHPSSFFILRGGLAKLPRLSSNLASASLLFGIIRYAPPYPAPLYLRKQKR